MADIDATRIGWNCAYPGHLFRSEYGLSLHNFPLASWIGRQGFGYAWTQGENRGMLAPETDFPCETTAMVQTSEFQIVLVHLYHEGR
jgi:hypothetical protein